MSTQKSDRPLSPHLGIYRWQISNSLSILHRLTGVGLVLGLALIALWFMAAAWCPTVFELLQSLFGSIIGQLFLFGFTAAFYYHFANGLRHLNWDTGRGLALGEMTETGILVVVFTITMTMFTWTALWARGVL